MAQSPDSYVQQSNADFERQMALRTADSAATFLVPHLHPGMRLLDVGCGPGSITLGLARLIAPGEAVGVDLQPTQVEQAAATARIQRVPNVRFEAADVYNLPFESESFDAVYMNGVAMHLRQPMVAFRECWRVLKAGGVIGVRDPDTSGRFVVPSNAILDAWLALPDRVRARNGNNLTIAREHRALLTEAGFRDVEAGAGVGASGTASETLRQAAFFKAQLPGFAPVALAEGWATQADIDAMIAAIDAWALDPGAFSCITWCHAVGRK
jgi:ubiquinone/menaquinone biosynthesis C-methylase UbiE